MSDDVYLIHPQHLSAKRWSGRPSNFRYLGAWVDQFPSGVWISFRAARSAHAYLPPEAFVRAVRAALSMDQQAYTSTCWDILKDIKTAPVDPLPPDFPVDPGAFIYRHWLVLLVADGVSETREMKEGANVIGQLPEGSVTLQVKRGEARLQPPAPGSCRVDGSPLGSAVTMANGEVIEIGAARYRYRVEARRRRTPAEDGPA